MGPGARGPAAQLLCWAPLEAWPAEVRCIRTHYRSLPGQLRPQAGDSWQSGQGTEKDMPQRGRSPGGRRRIRSPGVTKELRLRLYNAECSHQLVDKTAPGGLAP